MYSYGGRDDLALAYFNGYCKPAYYWYWVDMYFQSVYAFFLHFRISLSFFFLRACASSTLML